MASPSSRRPTRFGLLTAFALAVWACDDPVHRQAVAALGSEDPDVETGPLHRPGQPCELCHREGGEAEAYAVAGTVYARAGENRPRGNVEIVLIDNRGRRHTTYSNCAGNFFVRPRDFDPEFPLWVSLKEGDYVIDMESPIHRERSCASCHSDPAGPTSAGPAFLTDDPLLELADDGCAEQPPEEQD